MLLDKYNEEWVDLIKDYFHKYGNPEEWLVSRETDDSAGPWGITMEDGDIIFMCDSLDEAKVVFACMSFAYEVVAGNVLSVKAPEGDYFVGPAGNA